MKRFRKTIIILVSVLVILLLVNKLGIGKYFTLEKLKENSVHLKQAVENDYLSSVLVYIGIYTFLIACALPVVAPLTIIGGYLFHIIPGLVYAVTGATLGSVIYFLFVRYVISGLLKDKYRERLDKFNKQIKEYGYSYLLTLQLLTIFPFFMINTLAGLADVPLYAFIWTTVVGSTPLLLIYILAGRELGTLTSVGDILKPHILGILLLLALLAMTPMIIKRFKKTEW